jgi:4-amino-4-deoxy-L-arabinose transferase-like glycosyltransferase
MSGESGPKGERTAAFLVIGVLAGAFLSLVSFGPLGHDESVYALKARSWSEGTPDTGYRIYRPVGMAVVAWTILQVSDEEAALRLFGVVSAVAAVVLVWRLGRRTFAPATGLLAAALVGIAASWLRRAPEFLNDLAATSLLLGILLLLWRHFEDAEANRWMVVLAAPLGAAAFYLRYGAVSTLVIIASVGMVLWWQRLRGSWIQISVTALAVLAMVAPHLSFSIDQTGSPTGVLERASEAAGREYLGEGLVDYAAWFPVRLGGPFAGIAMFLALGAIVVHLYGRMRGDRLDRTGRAVVFLGLIGIAQIVVSGLFVHAEERYVFLGVALLTLVGCHVVVSTYRRFVGRRSVLVAAIVLVGLALVVNAVAVRANLADLANEREVIVAASNEIRAAAGEGDCTVLTTYTPQITWYSRCESLLITEETAESGRLLVLFEHGKRQPVGGHLVEYLDAVGAELITVVGDAEGSIGDARVFWIRRSGDKG